MARVKNPAGRTCRRRPIPVPCIRRLTARPRPGPGSRQKATDLNEIEGEPSLVVGLGASAGGYEALAQSLPGATPRHGHGLRVGTAPGP